MPGRGSECTTVDLAKRILARKAEVNFLRALEIRKATLGEVHPFYAR